MSDLSKAYKILGVSPSDSDAQIRKAWLRLVRTYHPDAYRGDPNTANARLAEINAAYDVVDSAAPQRAARAKKMDAERQQREDLRRKHIRRAEAARRAAAERRLAEEIAARKAALKDPRTRTAVAQAAKHTRRTKPRSQAEQIAARAAQIAFVNAKRATEGPCEPGAARFA